MDTPSYTSLLARRMGYTGGWGQDFETWLDADPARRQQYTGQFANQPAGWDRGLTPEEQAEAARFGQPTTPYDGGGVKPVGFVEPLNEWQKSGLTDLSNPVTAGNDMYAIAAGSLAQAPGAIDASRAPVSGDALSSRVTEFMNPYLDQVLGRTTGKINEAAEAARARLMASQGFRKAFGDTSLGVQESELTKNTMSSIGDATANLSYAGYNDATDRAISTLTGERDRDYRAAAGYGSLSGIASGLGGQLDQKQLGNAMNRLKAGTVVQGQNQNVLDVLKNEIYGVQGWDETKLKNLASLLGAFPNSTMSNSFSENPNTAARIGNAGAMLGDIDWGAIFG